MRAAIVCGSRDWTDVALLRGTLAALYADSPAGLLIIEGGARNADTMAGAWADEMAGEGVRHARFSANWSGHGRAAGPIRNGTMLAFLLTQRDQGAEVELIAFHDDIDRPRCGTAHMVRIASDADVPTLVVSHGTEDER